MRHGKRGQLLCSDIDHALKTKNIEPLYGFECTDYIPLCHTSGSGKDLYYPDDQEIDLVDIISSPLPKLPCEVTIRSHWLAVEGTQPAIPENVPPMSLEAQKEQAAAVSLSDHDVILASKDVRLDRKRKKEKDDTSGDWVKLKPLQAHTLSLEQQLYYKELTDTCVGVSDSKRQEALSSLSYDPGLYQLLPQLICFINEGIKVNIAQRKLTVLRNLLKMVKALLDNNSISIEKFLHELIPSILSCLMNRYLCQKPESEDHWSVRDLAAKIVALICKKYSNSVNNIQTRVTRIFSQALGNNTQGLAVHYGAVMGFAELGQESVLACVVPRLKQEGELIKAAQVGVAGPTKVIEQIAANKLQILLQRYCAPCLVQSRPATDTLQTYQQEYGYLGTAMFSQVKSLRLGRPTLTVASVQKVVNPSSRSPTSPLASPLGKTKPPPLSLPSSPVTTAKIQTPKGTTVSISSSTMAAALVQLASSNSSGVGSPVATIPVSLLSAVVNNPSVAQAVLASQLSTEPASSALSTVVSTLQEMQSSNSQPSTPK